MFVLFAVAALVRSLTASELPADTVLSLRLVEPVCSDRNSIGDPVSAVLTIPLLADGHVVVPAHSLITGWVRRARAVGLGLKHERALLDVEFDSIQLKDGTRLPIRARLTDIDNAREAVGKDGVIQGMRVTATMQGIATSRLMHLPTLNPYPHPALMIHKAFFPYFPQPEIRLPRGTDLRVRLAASVTVPASSERLPAVAIRELPDEFTKLAPRVKTHDGAEADVMNVVLIGDREEVRRAFDAAGWSETRNVTARGILRSIRDVLKSDADPNAPMSRLYWNGHAPELKFQKSLNTFAKRHHVRVWSVDETPEGKTIWMAAATHDTGVKFIFNKMRFTHGISQEVDVERQKIVDDLVFPGCVAEREMWNRESLPLRLKNGDGGRIVTDGALAVIELKPCEHPRIGSEQEQVAMEQSGKPFIKRYLQRQLLVVRHDFLRSNVVYGVIDLSRYLIRTYSTNRQYARAYKTGPYITPTGRATAALR